jgi:hypothetical protein
VKKQVGKTVGVYEQPAKRRWLPVVIALAVIIAIVSLALVFFGEARATTSERVAKALLETSSCPLAGYGVLHARRLPAAALPLRPGRRCCCTKRVKQ